MDSAGQFLVKGDLIRFGEVGTDPLLHWGVYDGQGNVIHVNGDAKMPGWWVSNTIQATTGFVNAFVVKDLLSDAAAGRKFFKQNHFDGTYTAFSPDEVVRRAESRIGERVEYTLIGNNCEHFATWARYNKSISRQGELAKFVGKVAVVGVAVMTGNDPVAALSYTESAASTISGSLGTIRRISESSDPVAALGNMEDAAPVVSGSVGTLQLMSKNSGTL